MNNFVLAKTAFTPYISLDANHHILDIQGQSYPENARVFYAPVFAWLKEYFAQLDNETQVTVNLDLMYYNSSSARILSELLDLLNEKAFNDAIPIDVNWFYETDNDGILESGREFQADCQAVVFRLIPKPED